MQDCLFAVLSQPELRQKFGGAIDFDLWNRRMECKKKNKRWRNYKKNGCDAVEIPLLRSLSELAEGKNKSLPVRLGLRGSSFARSLSKVLETI